MQVLFADALFYMAVVADECDAGRGWRYHLIGELARLSSLDETQAAEVVDALIAANKLLPRGGGRFVCA